MTGSASAVHRLPVTMLAKNLGIWPNDCDDGILIFG